MAELEVSEEGSLDLGDVEEDDDDALDVQSDTSVDFQAEASLAGAAGSGGGFAAAQQAGPAGPRPASLSGSIQFTPSASPELGNTLQDSECGGYMCA